MPHHQPPNGPNVLINFTGVGVGTTMLVFLVCCIKVAQFRNIVILYGVWALSCDGSMEKQCMNSFEDVALKNVIWRRCFVEVDTELHVMALTAQTPKCHYNRGAGAVVVTCGRLCRHSYGRKSCIKIFKATSSTDFHKLEIYFE